ncbi:hypothetical protein F4802DRAFT_542911 [Xylaria palmicola]|nr:hypothetical protein F4802DRAFT_542911 [Xylaria palmicola]
MALKTVHDSELPHEGHHLHLHHHHHHHTRPLPCCNETGRWALATKPRPGAAETSSQVGVWRLHRSRDNRKGRHAMVISPQSAATHGISHPRATDTFRGSLRGIWRMAVRYPISDISYDVAVIFTWGSVIWVVNGFFNWLPTQWPATEFGGEVSVGGGVTALVGATVFEVGSVLLMLEAVNEKRTDCFGWAVEEAAAESRRSPLLLLRSDREGCTHHHAGRGLLATTATAAPEPGREARAWEWWPTWDELRTHYLREIGFLACLAQFVGATVFWISGFTALPSINSSLSRPAADGVFWLPQVVGGAGFIISSWLFMVETQPTWYTPAPRVLGWHIGFWNLIGALDFTACGALGFASGNHAAAYASNLSTFIGSWAFLIGSLVQWYESLEKYPVSFQ